MAGENKGEAAAAENAASKKKLAILENKAVLLGGIVFVQAALAIALTQFMIVPKLGIQGADMAAQQQPTQQQEVEAEPDLGIIVGLEEIIVTLQSAGKRPNYLRINVNLEVEDQMCADLVVTRLAQLRDIVIMILSAKQSTEITSPEGKQGIRDEIYRQIAAKLPEGSLRNVYFSDLVIQ